MSDAPDLRETHTPNFNLNLPDVAGDWDLWGFLTNDNWTFIDGALLPIWGGTMTGLLTLFGDPVTPLGAATRRYVDAVAANQGNYLPLAGGTMTGPLQVPQGSVAGASVQLGAANNGIYAPANGNVGIVASGTAVFGTSSITARFLIPLVMSAALTLAGDPAQPLQAATKQYVDAVSGQLGNYLPVAGGQMTGPLITTAGTGGSNLGIGIGNNTTGLWSSAGNALVLQTGGGSNLYLSPTGNQMAVSLAMMGSATLTLGADPAQPLQAATKQYVDANAGAITVSDAPPASPRVGSLWFDSVAAQTYLYYQDPNSTQWVPVSNAGGGVPEAPGGGGIYGRRGSDASWQQALPLTGGTLTGTLNGAGANFSGVINTNSLVSTGSVNGLNGTIGGVVLLNNGVQVQATSYFNYTNASQVNFIPGVGGYPYTNNGCSWGVPGNAWFQVASYNFPNESDPRNKRDMVPAPAGALDKVQAIPVYHFVYANDTTEKLTTGFDATEVRQHHAHAVMAGSDEAQTLAINLPDMIALLWQAVQELASQVSALEAARGA